MKSFCKLLLLTSFVLGMSTARASGCRPKSDLSKQYPDISYNAPAPSLNVFVPFENVEVFVIGEVNREVLTIQLENEAAADVASIIVPVAHGPPERS